MKLTTAFVTLASTNFDSLVEFYRKFLNQAPTSLIPNVYAEFHLPDLKLGIFRPKASPHSPLPTPHSPLPNMSLCLEVENLGEAIAHLNHLGYPPRGEILMASHGREIYAYDPDGNCLILHQGVNK